MIKVLEKQVADKIAAGEVIDRPYSIIKELVENSIDAGSSSILVDIKNGGKTYIRVTDNGSGIKKDEIETAFLRHATSKINSIKDLNSINTLGFRGEALASIVAVSRTEVLSKTKDEKTGTRLLIHGDEIIQKEDIGCPNGTTIIVRDLFYNTPARQKFLKSDSVEATKIIDFLSEIALCYKDIKFRLDVNEQNVFNTLGDGNRLNTIIRVFKDIDVKNLVEVNSFDNGLKLTGYISTPLISKNNRSSEIFFVNGRVVDSKVIEKGLNVGYKERLFEGRFPIAYLFLEVNPNTLDCNIHPNKREVRFDNEQIVSSFIANSIINSLNTKRGLSEVSSILERKIEKENSKENENIKIEQMDLKSLLSTKEDDNDIKSLLSTNIYNKDVKDDNVDILNDIKNPDIIEISRPSYIPFSFENLEITGSIFDTYITCVDSNSFYLIDQHAAQERIFYEKLVGQYDSLEKDSQPIIVPIIISTSLANGINDDTWIPKLEKMGFEISNFGNNTYRISMIPMFMELSEAETFVNEFISNINSSIDLRNTVVVNKLITMSCKKSIKAHDKISIREMEALLKDLSNCINPFSCPHGRPTVIKLSQYEIERMFKRV